MGLSLKCKEGIMSRIAKERSDASAPVLHAPLLERIQHLNLDYLELLCAEHAASDCAAQLQYFAPSLVQAIVALSPAARQALAAAPFALYSFGFDDSRFWRAACECSAQPVTQRYAFANEAWLQGPFSEIALLHAWHAAASNPLAARMVYAMPPATAERLASAPLHQVKRIASDYPALLAPQWPTNPGFWPDLVSFAARRDAPRLRLAQLVGHHLIADELECALGQLTGGTSVSLRSARAARLRARKLRFRIAGGLA
jgi:hypothetical protein